MSILKTSTTIQKVGSLSQLSKLTSSMRRFRHICLICCTCLPGMLESSDPRDALDGFATVVKMEQDQGEWCVRLAVPDVQVSS